MPSITTDRELRRARSLDFCYLCGREFTPDDPKRRDHVPPRKMFHETDRNPPLILPAHEACNEAWSVDDEKLNQLIAIMHRTYPREDRVRLDATAIHLEGEDKPLGGLENFDWPRMIFRCVRGFHAALYREFMADDPRRRTVYVPFPEFRSDGEYLIPVPDSPARYGATNLFRAQRKAGRTDRVECCNGKCVYECTWGRLPRVGFYVCLFGLRVYKLERLGDPRFGGWPRGCLGYYAAEAPFGAATMTPLYVNVGARTLDPFAE